MLSKTEKRSDVLRIVTLVNISRNAIPHSSTTKGIPTIIYKLSGPVFHSPL